MKILVRTPNWIGDHVMARPFYRALRSYYSKAQISFLCAESILGFDDRSFCDSKRALVGTERKMGAGFFRLTKELRAQRYDLSLSLPASFSSSLLFALARIPLRVGFAGDGNQILLSDALRWPGIHAGKHKSELYLSLFEFLTGTGVVQERELVAAPVQNLERRIVIAPGASLALREWPYFEGLVRDLSKIYPEYTLCFVGTRKEAAWHQKIQDLKMPQVQDWIEKTTPVELIELCSKASLVIGNDSGVAHVAATMAGVTTLVIFGPGDPRYIAPIGPFVHQIRVEDLPCSPCEKPYCLAPYGYQKCLRDLSVEALLSKVKSLLPIC